MLKGLKLRKYITSLGGDCFNTLIVLSEDIKGGTSSARAHYKKNTFLSFSINQISYRKRHKYTTDSLFTFNECLIYHKISKLKVVSKTEITLC